MSAGIHDEPRRERVVGDCIGNGGCRGHRSRGLCGCMPCRVHLASANTGHGPDRFRARRQVRVACRSFGKRSSVEADAVYWSRLRDQRYSVTPVAMQHISVVERQLGAVGIGVPGVGLGSGSAAGGQCRPSRLAIPDRALYRPPATVRWSIAGASDHAASSPARILRRLVVGT